MGAQHSVSCMPGEFNMRCLIGNISSDGKKAICLVFWCVILVLMPLAGSDLAAQQHPMLKGRPVQQGGRDNQIDQTAEDVRNIAESILLDYVLSHLPLTTNDIEQIQEQLKKSKKYFGRFTPQDKAYLSLLRGFLAHYSNDPKEAFKQMKMAVKLAPENTDMSDSLILLALLREDYETAKKALEKRKAGTAAVQNIIAAWQRQSEPAIAVKTAPKIDPNEYSAAAGGAGLKKASKTASKWKIGDDQSSTKTKPKSKSKTATSDPNTSYASKAARPRPAKSKKKKSGRGPTMGVGRGLGGLAPVPPNYLEQDLSDKPSSSRPTGGRNNQPMYRPAQKTQAIINLPVDYMPFTDLGEDFPQVQLRGINGSYFTFQPGQGQILCALLWTIPQEEQTKRRTPAKRRGQPASDAQADLLRMMGMGDSVRRRAKSKDDGSFEAAFDLWTNADQFKQLFGLYTFSLAQMVPPGTVSFVGINYDPASQGTMNELAAVYMDQSWPWANCVYDQQGNREQLAGLTGAGPVMVLVGANGKICYAGPVGGALPGKLLERELTKAIPLTAARSGASPSITASANDSGAGLMGLLFGKGDVKKTAQPAVKPKSADRTEQAVAPTQPATPKPKSLEEMPSIHQAQQMLQLAHRQKKIGVFNSALQLCDNILDRWSDSVEAEKAKLLITSILRRKPNLKKLRQEQGKYTGEPGAN